MIQFIENNYIWFLCGILVLVITCIVIFLYPKYKLYQLELEQKKSQVSVSEIPEIKSIPRWVLILYICMAICIPGVVFFFYRFVYKKVASEITKMKGIDTIPDWVWFIFLGTMILVILWYFRKKISFKKPNITWKLPDVQKFVKKFSWKWLWSIPIFIGSAWLIWLVYSTIIAPWLVSKYAETHPTQSSIRYTVDPLNGSPDFNTNGRNSMKKGEFFQFTVGWDEPGISYDPIDSDTTLLFFQKSEDITLKWTLKLWKNESGEKEYLWSPIAPVAKVWVGKIYVKCINRSAIVVVSKKE